jgi:hypothetical protein
VSWRRLVRNCERELRAHPDAPAHAVVARLHTLAAASWQPGQTAAARRAHLDAAVVEYRAALAIAPRAGGGAGGAPAHRRERSARGDRRGARRRTGSA